MGTDPRILVAEPDRSSRRQIARLLRRIGLEAAEAASGLEALELVERTAPALVLLEVNLPDVSGYEVCREVRERFGDEIAIIFLSAERTTPPDRVAGLLVGADDYIVKPYDADELLARVRAALRRVTPQSGAEAGAGPAVGASLTAREREVLRLLARGLNQTEIAKKLVLSPKTVGGHIQRILAKLGVHSRAQAVALAHEEGLADVEGHGGIGVMLRAV